MRYFVFVDTPYYPYVDDPVEAATIEEARAKVAESLRPGDNTTVYLVPAEAVETVSVEGPNPAPSPLLKLLQESNRFHQGVIEGKNLSGGYTVKVEAGSLEPSSSVAALSSVLKEPWDI